MSKVVVGKDIKRYFAQIHELNNRVLTGALDPAALRQPIQQLLDGQSLIQPASPFAGMIPPLSKQLAAIREENRKRGWGFYDGYLAELEQGDLPEAYGEWFPVAVPHLATFQKTLEALISVISEKIHADQWPCYGDLSRFRLLDKSDFNPGTIQMAYVNFAANQGSSPESVSVVEDLVALEVFSWLAFTDYSPPAMNGKDIPYLWVPGIQIADRCGNWSRAPLVMWDSVACEIILGLDRWDNDHPSRSVPVRRECARA